MNQTEHHFHICRHEVKNSQNITQVSAGKVVKGLGCVLTIHGKEVDFRNQSFEVLIANNGQWVQRHGTDPIPESALVVGSNGKSNTYIGRCFAHNSEIIGKIDYKFYYGSIQQK